MSLQLIANADGASAKLAISGLDKLILNADNTVSFGASPVPADISTLKGTVMAQFGASLLTLGWQKLPSGLILQWGNSLTDSGGNANVSYPVAFPNSVLLHTTTPTSTSVFTDYPSISQKTGEGSKIFFKVRLSNSANVGVQNNFMWFAIGY